MAIAEQLTIAAKVLIAIGSHGLGPMDAHAHQLGQVPAVIDPVADLLNMEVQCLAVALYLQRLTSAGSEIELTHAHELVFASNAAVYG